MGQPFEKALDFLSCDKTEIGRAKSTLGSCLFCKHLLMLLLILWEHDIYHWELLSVVFGSPTADGEVLRPGVVAAVWELSQEEEGELGLQSLVVVGPAVFLVDIWGLAAKEWESLLPAYTSSSNFCEKLSSGDAGERDNVSGEMGSASGVSGMLSWLVLGCWVLELL